MVFDVYFPCTPPKFNMERENDGFQARNLQIFQGDFFSGSMLNFMGVTFP